MILPRFALPAALAAVFALTAGAEICTPLAAPGLATPIRIAPAAATPAADPSAGAGAWSAAILQRPLFRPDRRPLAPDAMVAAPLPRLSAIVITAAGRTAIFTGDDGSAVAVAVGGMIDGQRIETIDPGGVKITGPAGSQTLRPQFAPPAQPDAAVPYVPAPRLPDHE
jgi:general secretion pathway protein N